MSSSDGQALGRPVPRLRRRPEPGHRYQLGTQVPGLAVFTVLWGVLASLTGPLTAIAIAGVLILATPLLLPRPRRRRGYSQPPCLTSRQRCTLVAEQHIIIWA
jgi:hypothetical protein